jgi:holin-like protein
MLLLFLAIRIRRRVPEPLQRASQGLLGNLSLLFVPAGVGVIVHLQLLAADWWRLLISIVASTLVTLLVTALVMQGMIRLRR